VGLCEPEASSGAGAGLGRCREDRGAGGEPAAAEVNDSASRHRLDQRGLVGMRKIGDHAVVLGASIGGLLAARVLADAYQRVTIVDRDLLPEGAADRRGTTR